MRLAKPSKAPKPPSIKSPKAGPGAVKPGYGMKHQLRKGTEFPGMTTDETGLADPMSDYARMVAAGGQ